MAAFDKRSKALGCWKTLGTSYLFQSKWFNLRQDAVRVGEATNGTYTYIEHPGSVFVVPVTANGEVVLIRSYRFPIDAWCWEVPAGSLGDVGDASAESAARRELEEEAGVQCGELRELGQFYLGNGFASHRAHFFLALDAQIALPVKADPLEQFGEVATFNVTDVERLVRDGLVNDGDSAFALLLALNVLGTSIHGIKESAALEDRNASE